MGHCWNRGLLLTLSKLRTMNELIINNGHGGYKRLPNCTEGQQMQIGSTGYPVWTAPAGTYTPIMLGTANIDNGNGDLRSKEATYSRVGNMVTVAGQFVITPTADATLTSLTLSLPIESTFATKYEAAGIAAAGTIIESGGIEAVPSESVVTLSFISTSNTEHVMYYSFSYQVIEA